MTLTYDDEHIPYVALLAEGVDRNYSFHDALTNGYVALLAEGVDRNYEIEVTQELV